MNFNKTLRASQIEGMQKETFDLLIIGGGITGAGILLDAASRGLKVALFEKDDFAEGTSSRSTKLVHGGLRYMKYFELGMVRHSGKERSVLYQNAPHIVYPQKMILPIFKGQGFGKLITSFGLWVYDVLAGVKQPYKRLTLSKVATIEKVESIKTEGLKGAVQYYEYRTNDSRLVIETIKKAVDYKGIALNYCKVININNDEPIIEIEDRLTGAKIKLKAKVIINATGPWSGGFMGAQAFQPSNYVLKSKGIHIVVDKSKLKLKNSVYIELEDERMIFAIPADDKVYIGTTDDIFTGNLDAVYAESSEVEYLIKAINQYFNSKIEIQDIETSWAGIRPLYNKVSKSVSKVSRKEKMIWHNEFLMSIVGGKLTAYRLMAQKAVDAVLPRIGRPETKACFTKIIKLSGGSFDFEKVEEHKMIEYAERKFNEAYQLAANTALINKLVFTYGNNVELIIDKAFELYNQRTDKQYIWLEAEIWYGVEHEMIINLSDLLMRRSDRFYFESDKTLENLEKITNFLAQYLNWNEDEQERQVNDYKIIVNKNKVCLNSLNNK